MINLIILPTNSTLHPKKKDNIQTNQPDIVTVIEHQVLQNGVQVDEYRIQRSFSNKILRVHRLTRYTLALVCIFSIVSSIHHLKRWQGEFVQQSRASLVGDHVLYSLDLNVLFRGDIVRRNKMLIWVRGSKARTPYTPGLKLKSQVKLVRASPHTKSTHCWSIQIRDKWIKTVLG